MDSNDCAFVRLTSNYAHHASITKESTGVVRTSLPCFMATARVAQKFGVDHGTWNHAAWICLEPPGMQGVRDG